MTIEEDSIANGLATAMQELKGRDEIISGLERRLLFMLAQHSDDWKWWQNQVQQTLRWLDHAQNKRGNNQL